jgi:hypothetical protein
MAFAVGKMQSIELGMKVFILIYFPEYYEI